MNPFQQLSLNIFVTLRVLDNSKNAQHQVFVVAVVCLIIISTNLGFSDVHQQRKSKNGNGLRW